MSDSVATPGSYYSTPSSSGVYANPRASTGVIPISTQTFVNVPPPSSSARTVELRDPRPTDRFDSYTGRPRRSSLLDGQRSSTAVPANAAPSRSRPTVIQHDGARPSSPLKQTRDKEYYVTPATSSKPKVEHKKLYSVDDGNVKLVADVNTSSSNDTRDRHHRRRNSVERSGYRTSTGDVRGRDGHRPYHTSGGTQARNKNIDDDDAYSYTDAAGMYRDTEPRWRPRRGSLDRSGTSVNVRERPSSMAIDSVYDPRTSNKDMGPPVSTRGWDKLNDGLGRARSVRDPTIQRQSGYSPTRGRYGDAGNHADPKDPYYVPARADSRERRAVHHDRGADPRYDQYDAYDERREPRRERRSSITRPADRSVERRGFGIRPASRDPYGRGSNESFEKQYVDAGYVEPHRRDTAPSEYHDEKRSDQERKERSLIGRSQNEQWDRDGREKDTRWKEDDRAYHRDRDYDRERDRPRDREREHHADRERERERERMMEREPERDRERHHHRRDTDRERDRDRDRDREREYNRKENGEKDQSSGLAKAATGSLAGAAAAFGLGKLINKDKDKDKKDDRDRDSDRERERNRARDDKRERDRDRERDPERDREREVERDRPRERDLSGVERRRPDAKDSDRDRDRDLERERDLDRDRARDRDASRRNDVKETERDQKQQTSEAYSDESAPSDRDSKRDNYRDNDRGLGFAFEGPPAVDRERDRGGDRDGERSADWDRAQEREHEDKPGASAEMPKPNIDPDEDYRRRMEQVQRELSLGRAPEPDNHRDDADPDRQRRQREREQRLRERSDRNRNGEGSPSFGIVPGVGNVSVNNTHPPPARTRSFDDESEVSRGTDLLRKPSILDMPMQAESAQIIDNSMSERKENRVRIVDPPTDEEERRPKGILKKPTEKFPEHQNNATKKGIPPGARWTKIDRRLVNPESLNEAKERFEERLDCVIVLRVLTKEEIQKLADRTTELRALQNMRASEDERAERKSAKRRERRQRDEYSDLDSEDEYAPRAPKMLEAPSNASGPSWSDTSSAAGSSSWAPSSAQSQQADFSRDHRERARREPEHA
nr:isoform 2 of nipped-b-like protein b [Quercus suber]